MCKDTVYRIEERKHPHVSVSEFITNVFNPLEKMEKLISEKFEILFIGFREKQKPAIHDFDNSIPISIPTSQN
jgi:hypothetical protein